MTAQEYLRHVEKKSYERNYRFWHRGEEPPVTVTRADNPPRLLPPTRAQWLDECLVEATERAYELRLTYRNGEVVAQFFNHDYPCYTRRFQLDRSS